MGRSRREATPQGQSPGFLPPVARGCLSLPEPG